MKDWRMEHKNWCDYCDNMNSEYCKDCKPPRIREGYENKRKTKKAIIPPSEWDTP